VGYLENLAQFLEVLELGIPRYFSGISAEYSKAGERNLRITVYRSELAN